MRSEEFLRLYRVLEEQLGEKYAARERRHPSAVMEYLADPESIPFREKLDLCREMRNLITHNADQYGQTVAEPSQGTLESLQEIVDYVSAPPLALAAATPAERLLAASEGARVLPLMRQMTDRGFSHAPVLDNGRVTGVFSVSTPFAYLLRGGRYVPDGETTLRMYRSLLPLEAHVCERFQFMDEGATRADARHAFTPCASPMKRLAAIFITRTGAPNEPVLGMLTPWDVNRE